MRRVADARTAIRTPPSKDKYAAHELPMAANGAILADHEIGPAQFVLHLLVALFDPVVQAIEPHDFGRESLFARQIGGQVPS